jgi:hypothetical protein
MNPEAEFADLLKQAGTILSRHLTHNSQVSTEEWKILHKAADHLEGQDRNSYYTRLAFFHEVEQLHHWPPDITNILGCFEKLDIETLRQEETLMCADILMRLIDKECPVPNAASMLPWVYKFCFKTFSVPRDESGLVTSYVNGVLNRALDMDSSRPPFKKGDVVKNVGLAGILAARAA